MMIEDDKQGGLIWHPGKCCPLTVNIGSNQPVTIEKEYGPRIGYALRVTFEWKTACWVIQRQCFKDTDDGDEEYWVEVCTVEGNEPELQR